MSEWIPCHLSKPPESHTVLLYCETYHTDGKSLWDWQIIVGFYGDNDYDEPGFYIETLEENLLSHRLLKESDQFKVLAWTLLPRRPYKKKFDPKEWSW